MAPTEGRVAKPEWQWDCRHSTLWSWSVAAHQIWNTALIHRHSSEPDLVRHCLNLFLLELSSL